MFFKSYVFTEPTKTCIHQFIYDDCNVLIKTLLWKC